MILKESAGKLTEEDMEKLKEEYPDLYETIMSIIYE